MDDMSAQERLAELGGVCTRRQLLKHLPRLEVDRALTAGEILVVGRGRYALPSTEEAQVTAHALGGVLSHESAALHHGWAVKTPPERPHVTVARGRRLSAAQRAAAVVHYAALLPEEVFEAQATSHERTLLDVLRTCSFDAALAVADSALRDDLPPDVLRRVAAGARGAGAARVRSVADAASGDSANPFESVLRAICLDVPGLRVVPQRAVRSLLGSVRPGLVDEEFRIILEADSFEWHGDRAALRADTRRYDLLVAAGWTVLRFAWEDVMFDQDFVRQVLVAVVARVQKQAEVQLRCRCAA